MAEVTVDYAAVAADIELEDDIQITNKTDFDGGNQKLNEEGELEGGLQIIDKISLDDSFQMIEDNTDINHVVEVKYGKTEPDNDLQKPIEKIKSEGIIQKISEKIDSESGGQEKYDKKIRPEVDEQPHPIEEIGHPDNDKIRNSTGNSSVLRGEGKVLSRYLRAPTGSCHDLCKYGIKHGFEAKERTQFRKWLQARGGNGKGMEKVMISVEEKRKAIAKHSPGLRTGKPKDPVINEKSVSVENNLLSFEEVDAPLEKVAEQKLKSDQSKSSSPQVQKGSSSQMEINESHNGSSRRKSVNGRNKAIKKSIIGETNSEPSTVSSSQKDSSKKPSKINMKDSRNLRGSPHQINLRNSKVIKPEQACNGDSHEKTLHVIEYTTEKEPPESTPSGVSTDRSYLYLASQDRSSKHVLKIASKSGLPPSSRQSIVPTSGLPPSSKTSRAPTSTSYPSSIKSFRRVGRSRFNSNTSASSPSTKSLRPTQHRMHRARSSSPSPSSSALSMSKSSSSHGKRTVHRTGYSHEGQASKLVYKVRPRRGAVVASGNNFIPPRKLNFRRGKVIELPQLPISAPRRLKFRRPWPLVESENGNSEYRKRVMGTKEVDQGELTGTKIKSEKVFRTNQFLDVNKRSSLRRKEVYGNQSGSTKGMSEHIVLRHQMSEGKKNLQHLYNNVIEETASKLAETRKSKVKALVGAFETVISLEDSKPPAITSAC